MQRPCGAAAQNCCAGGGGSRLHHSGIRVLLRAAKVLHGPAEVWHTGAMLDRVDFEPIFFAPFVSSAMKVEPAWIDYNGHLNMAYYNVLFDRAVDEVFELLVHAEEGWVSATSENMSLHVDMAAKKVAPFPPEVVRRLLQMKASHGQLPRPEAAGRSVQMPVK